MFLRTGVDGPLVAVFLAMFVASHKLNIENGSSEFADIRALRVEVDYNTNTTVGFDAIVTTLVWEEEKAPWNWRSMNVVGEGSQVGG